MRKFVSLLALLSVLVTAAAASATAPSRAAFAGTLSLRPINGFHALVTFKVGAGSKTLTNFSFGSLGCFGYGHFPTGVDPYGTANAVGVIPVIKLGATGAFSITTTPTFADANGVKTTATITGTFPSSTTASGTITMTQNYNGDLCGPVKMKFTAQVGTPDSLGLLG
ncbi:MAG: hypothetical protein WCH31_09030 [Actinomycetes bacterium]